MRLDMETDVQSDWQCILWSARAFIPKYEPWLAKRKCNRMRVRAWFI